MVVLGQLIISLQGEIEDVLDLHAVVILEFWQDKDVLSFHRRPIVYGTQGGA